MFSRQRAVWTLAVNLFALLHDDRNRDNTDSTDLGGVERFSSPPQHSDQLWHTPSLCNAYRWLFPGGKAAGTWSCSLTFIQCPCSTAWCSTFTPPTESWFDAHLNTEAASFIDVGCHSYYVALNVGDDKCIMQQAISTQVFLGFPVSKSKCWDGSQDSKLPLHASHVALPT